MGLDTAKILTGHVMHARLFPKKNNFKYSIYYIAVPLSARGSLPIAYNQNGPMAFFDKDHADVNAGDLEQWARHILSSHNVHADGEIVLLCMPRILGYVFNPVSFWLFHDRAGELKAVLCEVHNTFGEKHTYLCAHENGKAIAPADTIQACKVFHVSPFIEREGSYAFRFESTGTHFKAGIDYFDADGKKQLVTSLCGVLSEMTKASCRRVFWRYPLITLKAIVLIHYQAVKLVLKKIRYIPRPPQKSEKISTTTNLTKI